MKKTMLILALSLLLVAAVIAPVLAAPTNGQKEEITLTWTYKSSVADPIVYSGPVMHRHAIWTWGVTLTFVATGKTYIGTAINDRDVTIVPEPDGVGTQRNYRDYYSITFPIQTGLTQAGGFEGNAMVFLQHYNVAGAVESKTHGLFMGTGAFEGQTINAGVLPWEPPSPMIWEGYILKA